MLLPLLALIASAAPISPRLLSPRTDAPVRAAIRFRERIGAAELEALRRAGAQPVELAVGGFAVVGRVVSTEVLQADLPKVAQVRGVVRIDPSRPQLQVTPLEITAGKTGARIAWEPPLVDDRYAGRGILVADHEGGWNIFHPDFFFLDGGRYDFEDVNGDDRAGNLDRIDLDGDGKAESVLTVLEAITEDIYTGERLEEPGYQPDVDWLYVDLNGNGRRDFGPGFTENTPGLSEPTFVGDDVDRDGDLDRYERLLRLGTSKVTAVVVGGTAFERGVNLSQYPFESFDLSHGTGAVGVVSAGAIGYRRHTGVAPEAELLLISDDDPIAGLAAAQQRGAHISFYEWDSPADLQDGSGPFETALSDAAAAGMVQLTATGNLANADHVMELVNLTGVRRVDFSTDGFGVYAYGAFWLNLHWQGPRAQASVRIITADGASVEVNQPFSEWTAGGISFTAFSEETAHQNGSVLVIGTSAGAGAIPNTVVGVEFTNTSSVPISRVRGVLFDDQSGWGKGISWLGNLSDAGSALMPSTSDLVIAVGAYGGRHDLSQFGWGGVDERRSYSGMGPRIDGLRVVDVTAPDDPFSPAAGFDPDVLYGSFGGTSGALPHTAGAAAVLLSSGVPYSHVAVEELLTESARDDAFTGIVPNEAYGFGKVDLGRALFGSSDPLPDPPQLVLNTDADPIAGRPLTISAMVSQTDVSFAFDRDYDGTEDQPLSTADSYTLTPPPGLLRVLVRGKNLTTGRTGRALAAIEVSEGCEVAGCSTGCCDESSGRCTQCAPPDAGTPDSGLSDAAISGDAGASDGSSSAADSGTKLIETPDRERGCACNGAASEGSPLLFLFSLALLLRRARGGSPRC